MKTVIPIDISYISDNDFCPQFLEFLIHGVKEAVTILAQFTVTVVWQISNHSIGKCFHGILLCCREEDSFCVIIDHAAIDLAHHRGGIKQVHHSVLAGINFGWPSSRT